MIQDILGLNPIVLSIIMVAAGVGIGNTLGWLKSKGPVDKKKVATSVIIGALTSFVIVTPIIQYLQTSGADSYLQFVSIIAGIATIAGIDKLVKNTGSAILAKK